MPMSGFKALRVKPGDKVKAETHNKIVDELRRLSSIGGNRHVMSTGAGNFSAPKKRGKSGFWEGTLQEDLGVASDRISTPETADVHLIKRGSPSASASAANLVQTTDLKKAVNRDPFAVYFEDEYVSGTIVHGEYRVEHPGRRPLYGTADAAIASMASGTVSLYDVGSDTGINVTVTNLTSVDIDISTLVEVTVDGPGERFIGKPLECPGTA